MDMQNRQGKARRGKAGERQTSCVREIQREYYVPVSTGCDLNRALVLYVRAGLANSQ